MSANAFSLDHPKNLAFGKGLIQDSMQIYI